MADTKQYLDYIAKKRSKREAVTDIDFSKLPAGVDPMAIAEELGRGLPNDYRNEIFERATKRGKIESLDYSQVEIERPPVQRLPPGTMPQYAPTPLNLALVRANVPPAGVAPSLPTPTPAEVQKGRETVREFGTKLPKELGKAGARGLAGVVSGGVEGLGNVAGALGALGFEEKAETVSDFVNAFSRRHLQNEEADILYDIAQGLGSTLPFMGIGRAVAGGVRMAGNLAKTQKGLDLAAKLGTIFGVSSTALTNAMVEGGSAAQELRYEGKSKKAQDDAFWTAFWLNVPVTAVLDRWMIGDQAVKNRLVAALRGGKSEFAEETLQNFITKFAQGKPADLGEALYEGGIGALVGGGMAAVSTPVQGPPPDAPSAMPGLPLSPELDEATKARAVEIAKRDPVAAMKSVVPPSQWQNVEQMAAQIAEQAEASPEVPAAEKRQAVQAALSGILQNSLAPATPATGAEVGGAEPGAPAPEAPVDPNVNFMRTQVGVLRMVSEKMGLDNQQISDLVLDKARDGVTLRNIVERGIAEGKTPEQMADEYSAFLDGIQRTAAAQEQEEAPAPAPEGETAATAQPEAPAGRWTEVAPAEEARPGMAVAAIDMTEDGARAVILKTGDNRFTVRSDEAEVVSPTDEDGLYFDTLEEARAAVEAALPEPGVAPAELPPQEALPVIQAAADREDGRPDVPEAMMEYEARRLDAEVKGEPVYEPETEEVPDFSVPSVEAGHPAALPLAAAQARFKNLTPEQHKALVRGRLAAGQVVPDEVLSEYPELEAESRQAAEAAILRTERTEATPILGLIANRGYINRANYEKHWGGEMNRDDMRPYIRKNGKITVSQLAEAAAEEGLIPEADEKVLIEAVNREMRERAVAAEAPASFLSEPVRPLEGTKVVDEQGRPLRVFHGTGEAFKEFSAENIGEATGVGDLGEGFYFTDNPEAAAGFAKGKAPNVRAVYLNMKNPATNEVILLPEVQDVIDDGMGFVSVKDKLAEMGYDGIVFTHKEGGKEYVVFSPDQIVNAIGVADPALLMEPGHVYTQAELFPTELKAFTISPAEARAKVVDDIKKVRPVGQFHDLRLEKAAERIDKSLEKDGTVQYVGQKIETIQDVAEIAAVSRHPFIEHLQLIFVKGGNFSGSLRVTSGDVGNVFISQQAVVKKIGEGMSQYKADGFYISHNHPSGNPNPSETDVAAAKFLGEFYEDQFKGSIVTNHKNFVGIDGKGEAVLNEFAQEKEAFRDPTAPFVMGDTQAARFTRGVIDGEYLGVMFADVRGNLMSFDHIDPASDISAYTKEHARKYGAPNVILVTGEAGFAKMPKAGQFSGMYQDLIVLKSDGEYQSVRLGNLPGWSHIEGARNAPVFEGFFGEEAAKYGAPTPKALRRAKPGAKLTARGRIVDPGVQGGGIPRGATVTVVDVDAATGQAVVEYEGQPAFATLDMFRETYQKPEPVRPIPGIPVKRAIEQATGVRPAERRVETTEMKALNAKLATEAKAARTAAKATKAELMEDIRTARRGAEDLRKAAVEYIGQNVPKAQQYKFVGMAANAKTMTSLAKVIVRADAEADKAYRRDILTDIKKVSERALSSMKVDVEYREAVKALLNEVDLVKRRPETMLKLKALQEYVNKAESSGKDIFLPDEMRKRLEILALRPVEDISNAELENALRDLYIIESVGREGQARKEMAWEVEKGEWVRSLSEAATPLDNLTEDMSNAARRWAWAQETYWSLAPMNVVFDRLDGGRGTHDGPHSRMKAIIDGDFFRFLDLRRRHIQPVLDLIDKHGLGEDEMNRIGIYAFKVQKDGVARVLASMPQLAEEYVRNLTLTGPEMEVYRTMRANMEALYPEMKRLMGRLYNREVGKVDNYFSMMTDWDKMMDLEVLERLSSSPDEFTGMRKNITAGFAKERKPRAKTPIKMNAGQVFIQHMTDLSYFVAMQENIKKFSEIVNNEDYVESAGPAGSKITRGWLDLLARQGKAEGSRRIAALDALRVNIGSAILGFKLTSFLIQTTSFMDGAALVGGDNMTLAMAKVLSNKDTRTWLMANFPKLRERVGDDISFRDLSQTEWLKNIQTTGYVPLKWLDGVMASTTTLGAYIRRAQENGVALDFTAPANEAALEYANWALDRTQASPFFIDVGVAFNSPKFLFKNVSVNKALLQFKQFVINRWYFMSYDIPRLESTKDKVSAYGWLLAAGAAEMGVRGASRGLMLSAMSAAGLGIASAVKTADDDDEMWKDYALNLLSMVPFLDAPMSAIKYGSFPIPVLDTASKMFLGARDAVNAQNGYRQVTGLRQALTALASLAGIPGTAQVGQILAWAYNPKTLTFPYNAEYRELSELGGQRTSGEAARLRKLSVSKDRFSTYARVYRDAMERGDMDTAKKAVEKAAAALEGL